MATIQILLKELCTGCSACMNVCPVHAIEMRRDDDGFDYPQINENCVNCGRCAATCPTLTRKPHVNGEPDSYAAWADDRHREKGSSGGVFSCLAEQIVSESGVVYGAAFQDGCRELQHVGVSKAEELPRLYKSKYVQRRHFMHAC